MARNSAGLLPIGGPPISLIRRATSGSASAATAAACRPAPPPPAPRRGRAAHTSRRPKTREALLRHGRHIGQQAALAWLVTASARRSPRDTCGATSTRFSMVKGNSPLITASTAGALPG